MLPPYSFTFVSCIKFKNVTFECSSATIISLYHAIFYSQPPRKHFNIKYWIDNENSDENVEATKAKIIVTRKIIFVMWINEWNAWLPHVKVN